MADFELLAPGGHQKLVDEVVDRLDLKADIDGYYAQLTAGAADNLTGRGDATTAEFLYRTAGGTADIETGQAVAKSVKGNTLVWNQLCNGVNSTLQVAGVTKTVTSSGGLSAHGTVTTAPDYGLLYIGANIVLQRDGRKYLFMLSKEVGFPIGVSGYNLSAANYRRAFIWSNNGDGIWNGSPVAYVSEGDTVDFDDVHASVFDLTAMFGAGNEPTTVAEFEALFPEPYYEYDAGSLLSVRMEGIETVGFNQWDEEWRLGNYDTTNGTFYAENTHLACKNPIPVFPNTDYYYNTNGANINVCYLDADKAYIGNFNNVHDVVRTTPANCRYIVFNMATSYGTTYKGDICINLSWSGRRNGEYEAFWKSQRLIDVASYFPDGMRSAGTVYDELTSTEAIQRVGVATLTTPQTAVTDVNGKTVWTFDVTGAIKGINSNVIPSIACDRYIPEKRDYVIGAGKTDNSICIVATAVATTATRVLGVYDPNVATATLAEAQTYFAAHPFTVYYALATPTVTPIDPPLNLTYRVDDFGTERVMVPEDERSAPPVLDIAYGLNVVDFVRRAPTQYISAASFAQYLLARDAHDGTTTTMTWDDTDNRYEFAITDTVTEG